MNLGFSRVCLLLGMVLAFLAPDALAADRAGKTNGFAGYTGSLSCRECHAKFYELWAPSHHGTAMQPYALARTNLIEHKEGITIGGYSYRADIHSAQVIQRGPGGEKRYPMEQALGGKNVFYFLTPLERGRLQVLPVAYDLRRREWFDTALSAVRHFGTRVDEPLHWTEPPYTFNTACFNCHVSQLTNNYTLQTDTYHTTWAEPGINCETCHGPAAEHVAVARRTPKGQPLKDLKLLSFKSFTPDQVNSLCGSCHARLQTLTSSFAPTANYFDHFGLVGLENVDFYPDGRELGEDFTYTGWRQSPCLKSGKLHCVTCHTSSGRYRFTGEKANDACLPCHEARVKDVAAHSRHKAGTAGAQCVSCHMPKTEFARMLRSDHSMRPPMPATTVAFGSPNACNLCHTNQTPAWADQQVRQWHKPDYQASVLRQGAWIAAGRKGDWSRLPEIVAYLSNANREEIWAAGLVQLLRHCELESKWPGILACLKDVSPLVRAAAVDALGDRLREEFVAPLLTATRDPFRLVRLRAAQALSAVPSQRIPEPDRPGFDAAIAELLSSFVARPDDAASFHNLGNFRMERQEYPQAIEAFETATRLRPDDFRPLVNLALAYNQAGQNQKAEASLRRASHLDPTNAAVQLNLGMLLAEMEKLPEAEQAFRGAFGSDPQSAQAAYNLGVMLAKDRPEEGLTWCQRAANLRPQEVRYVYTLAFFQNQQGKTAEAIATLEKLTQQAPAHAESYGLLVQLYLVRQKTAEALAVCRRAVANEKLSPDERAQFQKRLRALTRE